MTHIEKLEQEISSLKSELDQYKKDNSLPTTSKMGGLRRSKLWSSISHEIMTPMDAILGMTDLVLETELTDEQRNYLEMINASADRLFGVVSDIIDYSELAEGKLRQDILNFNLFDILEYDLYIAKLSAKHKDLGFESSFSGDIPDYITSDPSRLRQVLSNLVSNAIKFTTDGSIRVEAEKIGYDDDNRILLKFSVRDTGVGIPADLKQTIFQTPAVLGFTHQEDKYSEGGLGLVVSAKLVRLFGGEIGLESTEGEGATFWFTWPVTDPVSAYMGELPRDIVSEKQDSRQILQGAEVLLAEDEHINASITKAFLEQAGLDVTVVNNGVEAINAINNKDYKAVLMDVQMPVMDGIEATMKLRKKERRKKSRCPVIALTAHAMSGDRERCLQAGMDDYLPKPLDKDLLMEMLVRYMTKKVLIVGSEQINQHDAIQSLVETGWAVTIAETARLAMYEASLSHFDLIVIDTSMSVAEGVKTVQTIRKLEEFSGCRATIIGVGFTKSDDIALYSESGIDQFIDRTVASDDFRKQLDLLQ